MNRKTAEKRRRTRIAAFIASLALVAAAGAVCADIVVRALYPQRYGELIESSCEEFGVDESLVYAVIHTESGFDPQARSEAGAMGLMQLMPETFGWLQTKLPGDGDAPLPSESLFEPEINVRYGVFYLAMLHERFGDDTLTIAAYHAGQGQVGRWLRDEQVPPSGCGADDIPSRATGHSVSKVAHAREIYLRLYDI